MNRASLHALTWGTITAAVASAMLLAVHGDATEAWGPDRDPVESPTSRPMAVPGMGEVGAPPPEQASAGVTERP